MRLQKVMLTLNIKSKDKKLIIAKYFGTIIEINIIE
jgi:hypothetical protein